jgi:hypothetical protein
MPISKDLEAKTPRADLSAVSLIALNPSEVCQMLIDDAPLLEREDRQGYELLYRTIVAECGAESLLDYLEVMDFVDKFWEEKRYRTSIADVIDRDTTRWRKGPHHVGFSEKELLKENATAYLQHLPIIQDLSRLADNYGAARRKLQKDLRQMSQRRGKNARPSIAPEEKLN